MLRVEGIEVKYGRVPALSGVSLHVAAREIVSLIGANGAGKTTLLSTIAGLLKPVAGRVLLEDVPISGMPPESIARNGISLVPEGRHIFTKLTVRENLMLGSTVAPRNTNGAELDTVLDYFPALKALLSSSAGRLSGGEQQQLAIARALLSQPKVLLLDEPSLGLAPRIIDIVFETILQLRDAGMTVLLVEQFAERAREIADRTYVLRTGYVALEIGPETAITRAQLENAYFGLDAGSAQ